MTHYPLMSCLRRLSYIARAAAVAVAVACAAPAHAAVRALVPQDAVAADAASLVVDTAAIDLGEVALGSTPRATFSIRNTGTSEVSLSLGRLPRGLVDAKSDARIAPGATGHVSVTVDTFAAADDSLRFSVSTSAAAQPRLDLVVVARVRAFVQPAPPASRFTFVRFEPSGSTRHVIFATDTDDLRVVSVESPVPYIGAAFEELVGSARQAGLPGRQWQVSLTIARDAPVGPIGGYVKVATTHARQPLTLLPVSGFVRPQFAVTPPVLALGEVRRDASTPRLTSLVIKNFATRTIDVTAAAIDVPGLEVAIVPTEAGRAWRLDVRTADGLVGGPFSGLIRIATASADVPELTVKVSGTAIVP